MHFDFDITDKFKQYVKTNTNTHSNLKVTEVINNEEFKFTISNDNLILLKVAYQALTPCLKQYEKNAEDFSLDVTATTNEIGKTKNKGGDNKEIIDKIRVFTITVSYPDKAPYKASCKVTLTFNNTPVHKKALPEVKVEMNYTDCTCIEKFLSNVDTQTTLGTNYDNTNKNEDVSEQEQLLSEQVNVKESVIANTIEKNIHQYAVKKSCGKKFLQEKNNIQNTDTKKINNSNKNKKGGSPLNEQEIFPVSERHTQSLDNNTFTRNGSATINTLSNNSILTPTSKEIKNNNKNNNDFINFDDELYDAVMDNQNPSINNDSTNVAMESSDVNNNGVREEMDITKHLTPKHLSKENNTTNKLYKKNSIFDFKKNMSPFTKYGISKEDLKTLRKFYKKLPVSFQKEKNLGTNMFCK